MKKQLSLQEQNNNLIAMIVILVISHTFILCYLMKSAEGLYLELIVTIIAFLASNIDDWIRKWWTK